MDSTTPNLYCADSSALIDLHRRLYPRRHFPSLWDQLDALVRSGRLMICEEVFRELDVSDDELITWLKRNKRIIRSYDALQESYVTKVLAEFPELVDVTRPTGVDADAFVVGLALAETERAQLDLFGRAVRVVCHEGANRPKGKKSNIPRACQHYGLTVWTMLDLISAEDWVF